MRTAKEIRFRLGQELNNLSLLARQPRLGSASGVAPGHLPDPRNVVSRLAGTQFATGVVRLAESVFEHKIPIFNTIIETGASIDWRRDYTSNLSSSPLYFRLIPYLDATRVGDHKWIWELNRHQHLVLLAQAFLFTGERKYLVEIQNEVRDWSKQNPFERGINWASALEVAFRAMSWAWVLHLAGPDLSPATAAAMEQGLYAHSCYLENNLSVYFSPNTHMLGESVALHALAVLFPHFPNSQRTRRLGRRLVLEQMDRQIRADGSHFEQSTYYHVYALDMFLFHAVLEPVDAAFQNTLSLMADFLFRLLSGDGDLPFLGDDDGGRWFHPYGDRPTFGWATLATANAYFSDARWPSKPSDYWSQAAWWLPESEIHSPTSKIPAKCSTLFPDAGLIVMQDETCSLTFDAGPFGPGSAGHSHSDSLAITLSVDGKQWLVDPGTFTYVGSAIQRNQFRGSGAHNTLRIDGQDQAIPVNPFRWQDPPEVQLLQWKTSVDVDVATAVCRYRGFAHYRSLLYIKPFALLIVDFVDGPPGEHKLEQFWHLADESLAGRFLFPEEPETLSRWRSHCYGSREPAPVLRLTRTTTLPAIMPAAVTVNHLVSVDISIKGQTVQFRVDAAPTERLIIVNYHDPQSWDLR